MSIAAAIASAIISAAAKNMKQTGKGEREAERGYNIDALRKQYGLQTQQSPAMQSGASSPTANLMALFGAPQQAQKQFPVIGQALKGEETMLQNQAIPSVGGYTVQPQSFDSSEPYYRIRRMY